MLTLDRIYWWQVWKARGFSMNDLGVVINHLQRGIKDGKRYPGSLKWSHLIQQADSFEEELNEARACTRNLKPPPSHKEAFIHARIPIAGPVGEKCSAVPIATVLEAMRRAIDHPAP